MQNLPRISLSEIHDRRLERKDLIQFESLLREYLRQFVTFQSHCLLFPASLKNASEVQNAVDSEQAIYIPREKKLLLPLVNNNHLLGVFVANGVKAPQSKSALSLLYKTACASLQTLQLYKKSITDSQTGLFNLETFMCCLTREIDSILTCILPGPEASIDCDFPNYSANFGLILFRLHTIRNIYDSYGYSFGNHILVEISSLIRQFSDDQIIAARLDDNTFGLFHPRASHEKCLNLAISIKEKIEETIFEHPVTKETISLAPSAGIATYPHDMKGRQFQAPPAEQARIIFEKAQTAVSMAKNNIANPCLAFRDLLKHNGKILEVLPLKRMVVNLGRSVDAAEGQRFLIWSRKYDGSLQIQEGIQGTSGRYPALHKGEIQIMEVQDDISIAELLTLNDPSWHPEAGDSLTMLPDSEIWIEHGGSAQDVKRSKKNILTGLYPFSDFLKQWSRSREKDPSFSLTLLQFDFSTHGESNREKMLSETSIQEVAAIFRKYFPDSFGGRYSTNSLIFYLSVESGSNILQRIKSAINEALEKKSISLVAGLASYPFLNYNKSDTLENCRKALDHANLLVAPKVALFNSISLNISGDIFFARGDLYSAIEEYKMALLAEDSNDLARNSLAICYGRLGHLELAKKQFSTILLNDSQNSMAQYNYGCTCLKLNELEEAKKAFNACLKMRSRHPYSLLRLGQIAEMEQEFSEAQQCYLKAARTEEGKRIAYRYLARLSLLDKKEEQAREYLHQALLHNSKDAHALHMLASLYLEKGDDPELAESLSRQSIGLQPEKTAFWKVLIKALETQNKQEEADSIRIRISEDSSNVSIN